MGNRSVPAPMPNSPFVASQAHPMTYMEPVNGWLMKGTRAASSPLSDESETPTDFPAFCLDIETLLMNQIAATSFESVGGITGC
jgi:hypothetical protein